MPIPSSEPGKFKPAGSAGVQVDIGIGSNVFDAIAGAGKEFDKFREQRQKTLDNTASNRAVKMNKSLEETIDVAIVEAGAQNDPDAWGDIANGIVEQHRADLGEITAKASKETKESISFHLEDTLGGINRSMFLKGAKVEQDEENQSIISRVNEEVRQSLTKEELDASVKGFREANLPLATIEKLEEAALAEYRKTKVSLAEKQIKEIGTTEQADEQSALIAEDDTLTAPQKKSLLSTISTKKKSLFNINQKVVMEQAQLDAEVATDRRAIKDIKEKVNAKGSGLDGTALIMTNQMLERNDRRIRNNDISDTADALDLAEKDYKLILSGELRSKVMLAKDSLPPSLVQGLEAVLDSKGGPRGTDTAEFDDLMENLEDGYGWWPASRLVLDQSVLKFVKDPRNSADAKITAMNEAIGILALDVKDQSLENYVNLERDDEGKVERDDDGNMIARWGSTDVPLDSSQVMAIENASSRLSDIISFAKEEQAWGRSAISEKGLADIYLYMKDKKTINKFKGIDTDTPDGLKKFNETYDAVFQTKINEAISKTAKSKWRRRVRDFNKANLTQP